MKYYKIELAKGKEIDFKTEEQWRDFAIKKVNLLNVYLIEIHNVANPSTLSINFNIDPRTSVFKKYSLKFLHHRLKLVLQNGIYFFDSTGVEKLQNLPVRDTFKLRIENEDTKEDEKVIMYCTTDSNQDSGTPETEYL